jgi:glycosyltransferase involved in cell wall biosynthesis
VITLHDVNFIHHGLIADTAVSRDDVCATLGLAPSAFTVVHLGAERPAPVAPAPEASVRERYGLATGRIVLCVAAKRPHKNQALLVRALPALPDDVRLVLAGHAEPYEQELRALAGELGVADRVVFADWVPEADLEALWGLADVAAFPTRAEGFGLPIIEALGRGVPVACSDLPVLREVGGVAPRHFPPDDPDAAARTIGAMLADPPDPAPGREWAARFTWRAAAEDTWTVYDRVMGAGRAPA